ncbi:MAG: DUF3750 domain-containing protein [Pseudomonadota bacterium]
MNVNITSLSWRQRFFYAIALYAVISVGIGAAVSSSASAELQFAPDPGAYKSPVVQVYAARTWGKKGKLAVHTWIVTKAQDADHYQRHEIVGWQLRWSDNALRSSRWTGRSRPQWYGNTATLLVDHRGKAAGDLIKRIDKAISTYPFKGNYRLWPGPNSNTFTAYLGKAVPELNLDLPSTAVGKDYRPLESLIGFSASGSGIQTSLLGLISLSLGIEEGIEANLLGLNFEWDIFDWAIELPAIGRIGYPQTPRSVQ